VEVDKKQFDRLPAMPRSDIESKMAHKSVSMAREASVWLCHVQSASWNPRLNFLSRPFFALIAQKWYQYIF
jgi:hypothetical protein